MILNHSIIINYFKLKSIVLTLFISFQLCSTSYSQAHKIVADQLATQLQRASKASATESVYLQSSKGIYETGEDLWFKGYVLNKQYLTPSLESKTLYVQLVEETNHHPVWQEMYEIENGFVDGHLVQDTLKVGNYLLEAYTKYSFYDDDQEFKALRKIKIVERISPPQKDTSSIEESSLGQQDSIQFGLYPEGGKLVSGLQSVVAFKAVNKKGVPIKVSGALYENGKKRIDISSVYAGMGEFFITPDIKNKYEIRLNSPYDKQTYKLPEIAEKGKVLKLITNTSEALTFHILESNTAKKEFVYLRLQVRGVVYKVAKAFIKTSTMIKLPLKDVPQGIGEVTVLNKDLHPIAERLVYIKQDQKLYIKTVLDKDKYLTKEEAKLKIKVTDQNNTPVVAHLGLSVYDAVYKNPEDVKTIESHYHLSTQLRGKIYNPSYYFDARNKNRKQALDLLLLTQGWRAYEWNEAVLKEQYKVTKQPSIEEDGVKGKLIYIKNAKNVPKQSAIVIYDPLKEHKKTVVPLDELDNFILTNNHLKMGRRLCLKHFGSEKEKIQIITYNFFNTINKVTKNKKYKYPFYFIQNREAKDEDLFYNSKSMQEGVALDEVIVETKKKKIYRDKYMGKLDSLVNSNMTTDYVSHPCEHLNCPLHVNESSNTKPIEGKVYKQYIGFKWNENRTAYTINGTTTITYHYPKISEKTLLNMFNLKIIKGYYPKKEFYAPVYDKAAQTDGFPDYRNTLFWKPDIITNEKGEADISFYCSDINTKFIGVIEGVNGEGFLGTQNFEFLVSKRD
jgi:ribosomal protein S8